MRLGIEYGRSEPLGSSQSRSSLDDFNKCGSGAHPTRLLAAIGVRESGFQNIREVGGGGGRGVFQITGNGVTDAQAFNFEWAADWAAKNLQTDFQTIGEKFPHFTVVEQLQATAAAYNFGVDDLSGNPKTIDVGTASGGARGNYGSNVIQIAANCFSKR